MSRNVLVAKRSYSSTSLSHNVLVALSSIPLTFLFKVLFMERVKGEVLITHRLFFRQSTQMVN